VGLDLAKRAGAVQVILKEVSETWGIYHNVEIKACPAGLGLFMDPNRPGKENQACHTIFSLPNLHRGVVGQNAA
jgi:hypothetical protein